MDPNTNADNQSPASPNEPSESTVAHRELTLTPSASSQPVAPTIPQDVVPAAAPPDQAPINQGPASEAPVADVATPAEQPAPVATNTSFVPAEPIVSGDFSAAGTVPGAASSSAPVNPKQPRGKLLKALVLVLLVVVVLGGGSAAAYFGVVVPNKPANVLKTALINTLQSPQTSFDGSLATTPAKSDGGLASKTTFSGGFDSKAKTADVNITVTVSGVSIPAEARYVNNNVYFKLGDLSSVASIVKSYAPNYASVYDALSGKLSNQWFVIDSTVLNSTDAKCVTNSSWMLSQDQINELESLYTKNPFLDIQSTAADTVNGQKATKFNMDLNDDKAAAYVNGLDNSSIAKQLEKCSGTTSDSKTDTEKGDGKKPPFTVWIDKSTKRIVKLSVTSTGSDTDGETVNFTTNLGSNVPAVTAPAGAEPIAQLYSDLESAFGGTDDSSNVSSTASFDSTGTSTDQAQSLNIGSSLTNLNFDQLFKRL